MSLQSVEKATMGYTVKTLALFHTTDLTVSLNVTVQRHTVIMQTDVTRPLKLVFLSTTFLCYLP